MGIGKFFKKLNLYESLFILVSLVLVILYIFHNFYLFSSYSSKDFNPICYSCFWKNQPKELIKLINETLWEYKPKNEYVESDRLLILGRLNQRKDFVCKSLKHKENYLPSIKDKESLLVLYEELYFLAKECRSNKSEDYLKKILKLSEELNKSWKIKIYASQNNKLHKKLRPIKIERNLKIPKSPKKLVLGESKIIIDKNALICSQVDRFNRDWLSFYIYLFPTQLPNLNYSLKYYDINYMEGFLIRKIVNYTHSKVIPLPNSNVIYYNGKWYATDEYGNLAFEVLDDKVEYSTTLGYKDLALIRDTHGISALVPEAIYHNCSLVIGCGDSLGKMHAAYYLAKNGIDVYFPTDRFVGEIIGYKAKGILLGSAPVKFAKDNKVIIGGQVVEINISEPIVVEDTDYKYYPIQYYDTPARYFRNLEKLTGINLNLTFVKVSSSLGIEEVIKKAKELGTKVIAIRVREKKEYQKVKKWLEENKNHKAILFHSVAYEWGFKLFEEYPLQTTFGDPRPKFK